MGRQEEIDALGAQARAIGEQLEAIQARMGHLKLAPRGATMVAVVDPELCVGCGACEQVCPSGVISAGQVARVDSARCTGCGQCVAECPRGALTLQEV